MEGFMPATTDEQRAASVRAFYGLDGREPILAPGYLPSVNAPQGAIKFERSMRNRLYDLTRGNYGAGPLEAAALEEANLPLLQREDGRWKIDKDRAGKEVDVKADAIDQQNADTVRAFYGLDGREPILAPGYLPNQRAPQGASKFEKSTRKRLKDLSSNYGAGPLEAAALEEAKLPLLQREDGRWNIDKDRAGNEKDVKADAIDQQRADSVRAFYGLDGRVPVLARGYLPTGNAPQGASEFEKGMRKRLKDLTRGNYGAGPLEAAALEEAKLPLLQREGEIGRAHV